MYYLFKNISDCRQKFKTHLMHSLQECKEYFKHWFCTTALKTLYLLCFFLPIFSSQDLYLDLYTCMEYVLGHTRVTRWDLFQDIFHNATSMLSCPTDQSKGMHFCFNSEYSLYFVYIFFFLLLSRASVITESPSAMLWLCNTSPCCSFLLNPWRH